MGVVHLRRAMELQLLESDATCKILNPLCPKARIRIHFFDHFWNASFYFWHGCYIEHTSPGWACWSDEDYVGKVCRLVRRLNARDLVTWRCITRCLMKYKKYFNKIWDWVPGSVWTWPAWSAKCSSGADLWDPQKHQKTKRTLFDISSIFYQTSGNHHPRADFFCSRNLCSIGGSWNVSRILGEYQYFASGLKLRPKNL